MALGKVLDALPGLSQGYWLAKHFTPEEIEAGVLTGDGVSAAGDGIPNLLKRAWGMDPRVKAEGGMAGLVSDGDLDAEGRLVFAFVRLRGYGELSYVFEATGDLAAGPWSAAGLEVAGVEPLDADFERVTVRTTGPAAGLGKVFVRLRVVREE